MVDFVVEIGAEVKGEEGEREGVDGLIEVGAEGDVSQRWRERVHCQRDELLSALPPISLPPSLPPISLPPSLPPSRSLPPSPLPPSAFLIPDLLNDCPNERWVREGERKSTQ